MESIIIYNSNGRPEPSWEEGLLAFLTKTWDTYTFTTEYKAGQYFIVCNYVGETELQEQMFKALSNIIKQSAKGWDNGYQCGERDANRVHAEEAAGADL